MPDPSFATWTPLPHGRLEPLEENLWRVEGSLPNMPLKRVMTVARRSAGDLVIHNPIALDAASMTEIEALGRVGFLVAPNGWHRLDVHAFRARYPKAMVLAPGGARKKVAEVEPSVEDLSAFPGDPSVDLGAMAGTDAAEGVMTVTSASGGVTVVFADAVFNMPHLPGMQGFVLRHITSSSGGPRVSRIARLLLIKDKRAFADHLERLATANLRRVIVAHHEMIDVDPAGALRGVAASLR